MPREVRLLLVQNNHPILWSEEADPEILQLSVSLASPSACPHMAIFARRSWGPDILTSLAGVLTTIDEIRPTTIKRLIHRKIREKLLALAGRGIAARASARSYCAKRLDATYCLQKE